MKETSTLSLRVDFPHGGRLGPGKAELLQAIADTGSLKSAASRLEMSYPKALKLVDQLNADFQEPLVASRHGGSDRGGSALTSAGETVLRLYKSVCETAFRAVEPQLHEVTSLLKPDFDSSRAK